MADAITGDQVERVIRGIRREVAKQRDALALQIVDELMKKPPDGTPVRTGWARANAIPTFGAPAVMQDAPDSRFGKAQGVLASSEQQAAIATFVASGPSQPLAVAYVTLTYPYANRLNEGHSPQTAAGFWQRCVDRAIAFRQAITTVQIVKL